METDLAVEQVQFIRALDALVNYHDTVRARIAARIKTRTGEKTMNWMDFLVRALSNIPVIVAGIEQIHGDAKSGAEKKQLAMEALGLATAVAPVVDPAHADIIAAASSVASQTIDGVVTVMNKANGKQSAPRMPIAVVSSPNPGEKPPAPISPLAPQPQAVPAGESPKAPSSLDSTAPISEASLWP